MFFDDESKLIFFSDVHRGDNSWTDEFAPNQAIYSHALEYYLRAGFTYLEVGDGDELMKNQDYQCLRRAHPSIYHTLKIFLTGVDYITFLGITTFNIRIGALRVGI